MTMAYATAIVNFYFWRAGLLNRSSMILFIDDAAFLCMSGSLFKVCIYFSLFATISGCVECIRSLKSVDSGFVTLSQASRRRVA